MKRLLLCRHAHAGRGASDRERPLSRRGEESARRLGLLLSRAGERPDLVLASSAQRAHRTAALAAESGAWTCEIRTSRDLYATSPEAVLEHLHALDDAVATLMLVGHDPTATELAGRFAGGGRFALPAGSLLVLDFDAPRWREVAFGGGALRWMVTPTLLESLVAPADAPPLEIERKYLLRAMPALGADADALEIDQGWLPGDRLRERIRRVRGRRGETYVRTVKLGRGVARIEIEEPATAEVFEALWPLTRGCRVRKRRFRVPDGDLLWEIDAFCDRDLLLAEVELSSPAERPALPGWLAPHVVREVTDDPRFTNLALAESGGVPASD